MKKIGFILALFFLLVGCAGMQEERTNINLNMERVAGVGDEFFSYEFRDFPTIDRFDLTIVELSDQKIGLQYAEYFYNMDLSGRTSSGWMIKQGFNKRFDYVVADKVVRFKGYEFEIVSVDKGQIKYKRIK